MKKNIYPVIFLLSLMASAVFLTNTGEADSVMDKREKIIKDAARISEKKAARDLSQGNVYKVKPQYVHLFRVREFPGVVIVGEHVTTHSATLRGIYVGDSFGSQEEQSSAAMALAGWDSADNEEKCRLALLWAKHVICQFDNIFVGHEQEVFGKRGRPAWRKPSGSVEADGSVRVVFWSREVERGRCAEKTFNLREILFSPEGGFIQMKITDTFRVSNRELFERRDR